jgi:hypothetical protein
MGHLVFKFCRCVAVKTDHAEKPVTKWIEIYDVGGLAFDVIDK